MIRDVQEAADLLRPVYLEVRRRDGFVCLAIAPERAHDTASTLEEARRLWSIVRRENLLLDVPGTPAGIEALPQLLSESINVCVSLLFAPETYEQVAEAYFEGIERLHRKGGDLDKVASIASFTPGETDAAMDERIGERLRSSHNPDEQAWLRSLVGKVGSAAAKRTYQTYLELLRGDRWQELSRAGAQPQRLMWSSGRRPHRPARDLFYVEELVGAETVAAVSVATLGAIREHGRVRASLIEGIEEATSLLDLVEYVGLPRLEIAEHLLDVALKQRTDDFDQLLREVDRDGGSSDRDPTTLLRIKMFKELYEGRARS